MVILNTIDQEEEQKLRKVALNISKDVKKFWTKIEKLASHLLNLLYNDLSSHYNLTKCLAIMEVQVLYKHQLELDVKKKKALDKQLEFLLGQTERYCSIWEVSNHHLRIL